MVRTRFAPSPTGYPHIGGIWQIWINRAFADKNGGKFIIRLEDTDRTRLVPDAEKKLYEALEWFEISEDESPRKGGPFTPYRQSERLDIYREYAEELIKLGHAYYCFCSPERLEKVREEMQKKGIPPMYDKFCRNISLEEAKDRIKKGEKYVIRLKVPESQTIVVHDLLRGEIKFDSNSVDDQVLVKSDGFPTYHLAAIVDDHLMEITHAVRGEEWLPSAPKHILLYEMFGWKPPIYLHTPTLRNPDKSKLSKRQGHTNIDWYKEQGFLPDAVINFISQLGWTHPEGKEIFDREEFTKVFDLKNLSPAGPVFDERKLRWMNGKYIREKTSEEELFNLLKSYLNIKISDEVLRILIPGIKERLEVLSDINHLLEFMNPELKVDLELVKKQSKKSLEEIKRFLEVLKRELEKEECWKGEDKIPAIHEAITKHRDEFSDFNNREYFMTIRVATAGLAVTPPLDESIVVLGKDLVLKRLDSVLTSL